jgi:hypothetical protein
MMSHHKIAIIEDFIDFLADELEEEKHKPYVDWMQAKGDFRTFVSGYLLKYKQREGL